MADERSVDVDEPRDPEPAEATPGAKPACPCGSQDHQPVRIGERLSPSGAGLGGVYVCPAESAIGLRGVL
jgi:hypothetical protein